MSAQSLEEQLATIAARVRKAHRSAPPPTTPGLLEEYGNIMNLMTAAIYSAARSAALGYQREIEESHTEESWLDQLRDRDALLERIAKKENMARVDWRGGYYFNNAIWRIIAVSEYISERRYPEVPKRDRKWELYKREPSLDAIHAERNKISHGRKGIMKRSIMFNELIAALDRLGMIVAQEIMRMQKL